MIKTSGKFGTLIKNINKKSAVVTTIVILILILTTAILSGVRIGTKEIKLFYSVKDSGIFVVADDCIVNKVIPCNSVSVVKYSCDGASLTALLSCDGEYKLYYIDPYKTEMISADVNNRFAVSYNGSAVLYFDSNGMLKKYNTKSGKIEEIASGATEFAVSPDGNTVIYNISDGNTNTLFVHTKSGSKTVAEGFSPLAVSDKAKYIYAVNESDKSLCLVDMTGAIRSKLGNNISISDVIFSSDMKDVVFFDGNYSYMSSEGKSRVRLFEKQGMPFGKTGVKVCGDSDGQTVICSRKKLSGMFFETTDNSGKSYYYIDKNNNVAMSVTSVRKAVKAGKDKLVVLLNDGNIYSAKGKSIELLVSGAVDMTCTDNGKFIYYSNISSDLFVCKNGKNVKLASGISRFYMTNKNDLLFIMGNGDLYSATGMKYGKMIDTDIYGCSVSGNAVFCYKNYSTHTGDFELYASAGSLKFKKLSDSASFAM